MSDQQRLPVVRLELNAGVFRIPTENAIFEITVAAHDGLPQIIEKIVEREIPDEKPAEPPQPSPPHREPPVFSNEAFYKEISEEMYQEIGHLARQLSISIKTPLTDVDLKNVDLGKAGVDLESAKGQLQDVVHMTEKATMDIMDVSEDIQDSCDIIKKNLATLKSLQAVPIAEQQKQSEPQDHAPGGVEFFENLLQREQQLRERIANLPLQPGGQPVSFEKKKVYRFSLDAVFQTLYELCTNETVKKNHIRPMRESQKTAFNESAVLKAFSELAPTVPVEETFYQFPLASILKILFQNCTVEQFRQTLKKMHQSAATIFIDQTMPIEGTMEEVEVPVQQQAEPTPADTNPAAIVQFIDETMDLVRSELERLCSAEPQASVTVPANSHAQLVGAIESTDAVLQRIIANIRRILEALTFQDLSGQRIKKILNLLSDVQVQLLSILVTFGVKLKKKLEVKDITPQETEEIASREVDRIKNLVVEQPAEEGEEWSGPLNQDAVDKLLAELGF